MILAPFFRAFALFPRLRRHLEAGDGRLVELFEEARVIRERWAREANGRAEVRR